MRCLRIICFVIAVVVLALVGPVAGAGASTWSPVSFDPAPTCRLSAPPQAVPDMPTTYSVAYFDSGKHVLWDVGRSTGNIVGFRYEAHRLGDTWPGPAVTIVAHGADWWAKTDLGAGTYKVLFTVHDCFGRSDTATYFIEVTSDWRSGASSR